MNKFLKVLAVLTVAFAFTVSAFATEDGRGTNVVKNLRVKQGGGISLGGVVKTNWDAAIDAYTKGETDQIITDVSNNLTSAYSAADTVVSNSIDGHVSSAVTAVSNSLTSAYQAADTVVSNAIPGIAAGLDTTLSNNLTAAYQAADTVVSNAIDGHVSSAVTAVSNSLTSAFQAADTVVSNSIAPAVAAGVTALSNSVDTALTLKLDKANGTATNLTLVGAAVFGASAVQTLSAAGTIDVNAPTLKVKSDGAEIALGNPQVATAGATDGQVIIIRGTDATATINLVNGTGLVLENEVDFLLALNNTITLQYNGTAWVELSRKGN